ncbi:MAG: hypothetical protein ACE5SW_12875, partial [Nitrososphaeraceae archaeon]
SSDISSCIPLYIDKIPEIDQTFHDEEGLLDLTKSSTEEDIIKNTNIATFLMTFSEFYLAYKYASENTFDIILMDRSLSNMYSSLLYDTSNRKAWNTNLSIMNYHVDGHQLDINDLTIARYSLINNQLNLPPDRGNYLRYKIINLLSRHTEEFSLDQIIKILNIKNNKRTRNKIKRFIDKSVNEGIFLENKNTGTYIIKSKYRSTWKRIKTIVQEIGNKIFNDEVEPFILKSKTGVKRWLTSLDISFLTLFSFYLVIEECWNNNILLIGITKDTTAQEFKNHVIPICLRNNIWNNSCERIENNLVNAPNTDRMLLQSLSILNHEKINVPWSLIEYDAAFVTTVPDFQKRKGYVSGAIKNNIIPSHLFLRSFVQLRDSNRNTKLRSNILAIDRLVNPKFDLISDENTIQFKHDYGTIEFVKLLLFKNQKSENKIQNLLLVILNAMSSSNIGEAFGYNKALFVADKVAKWNNEEFGKIVDSASHMIICNKNLRNFVYYMNTFREKRQIFESNRRL